jgi:cytochrome c-type biogenesis protein CcmH
LQELDREIARGLLTPPEAAAARLEIQRRLLATTRPGVTDRTVRSGLVRSPILAAILFVVIALSSVGLYLRLGAPGVPDEPYAARQAERAAMAANDGPTLEQVTAQLAAKLQANPSDRQAWLLYARDLAMLNRWAQAEDAYRHAMALGESSPEVVGDHAEMLVLAAGGTVTPAAEAAFRQMLQDDPGNGMARYYLAMAAVQAGEPQRAIDMLQALLADMPANAPARGRVGQLIVEAAGAAHIAVPRLAEGKAAAGPDGAAMASAAQMTDAQRQAMIQGMVERLAAKQQADPGNLDGWMQLGRAYAVLHQPDKAADAYDRAAQLQPADVSIPLQAVRALLADHKPTDRLPARAVELLKRVVALNPQEPMALWFLGIAAAQDRQPDEARRYWDALLAQLPQPSDDARMVQGALDTLKPAGMPAAGPRAKPPGADFPASQPETERGSGG